MAQRSLLSLACFGAAWAWPSLVGAVSTAFMSPLERAARQAFCGVSFHGGLELLGHCAACWAGSSLLIATGLTVLAARPTRAATRQ